jgi:hypothetical protein
MNDTEDPNATLNAAQRSLDPVPSLMSALPYLDFSFGKTLM